MAIFCAISIGIHAQLLFPKKQLQSLTVESISSYLLEANPELSDISLQLQFYNKSLAAHHYTFAVLYKNIPLLNASIKINIDFFGNILSIKKENFKTENLALIHTEDEMAQWLKIPLSSIFKGQRPIKRSCIKIDTGADLPQLVSVIETWDKTYDYTYVIDMNGTILDEWNNSRYFKKDTLIRENVFKPDPLTFLGLTYGGVYIDDNDNNLAWFTPAYISENILATFETTNDTFYLENQWVTIEDFDSPNILPATSITPNFVFNRSQSGFEDVNVLYHITAFHDYIASIGYDTLMDDGIRVDTHGMLGGDNSMFNRNGGDPTLDFGPGGIDDAEDADVIIHEYSHALSWSANNNDNMNTQRSGLDEGVGDYFATSYSRSLNPFNWEKVFSWDGNAVGWNGRLANTAANYPSGGNIYAIGEIWNAAMSAIWTDLGQIVTDKLMLESMHFFTNSTNLAEAAVYVLQSDTILFNGIHTNTLCTHFKNKNIFDANCKPTSVKEVLQNKEDIQVRNTYGFAYNNEPIEIDFQQASSGEWMLLDMQGKKMKSEDFSGKTKLLLNQMEIPHGLYLLQINTHAASKVVKISK